MSVVRMAWLLLPLAPPVTWPLALLLALAPLVSGDTWHKLPPLPTSAPPLDPSDPCCLTKHFTTACYRCSDAHRLVSTGGVLEDSQDTPRCCCEHPLVRLLRMVTGDRALVCCAHTDYPGDPYINPEICW